MAEDFESEEYFLSQIPAPRHFAKPKTVGKVLPGVLRRYGVTEQLAAQEIQNVWSQLIDPMLLSETRVGNVQRGSLLVLVKNNLVLQELAMRKSEILSRFQDFPATSQIRGLRFRMESF